MIPWCWWQQLYNAWHAARQAATDRLVNDTATMFDHILETESDPTP